MKLLPVSEMNWEETKKERKLHMHFPIDNERKSIF